MKKIYLSAMLLLVSFLTFGQDGYLPLDNRKQAFYSDLGTIEKSRDILFQDAQKWVVKTFGNYENAVSKEDRQGGELIIKSYTPVSSPLFEYLRFSMVIDFQDNKFQASISEIEGIAKSQTVTPLGAKQNNEILEKSILVKTETNRKKKAVAEESVNELKVSNDQINQAMYSLLASLKLFLSSEND